MKINNKKVFSGLIVIIVLVLAVSIYIFAQNKNNVEENSGAASEILKQEETVLGQNADTNSSLPKDLVKNLPGSVSAFELKLVDGQSGSAAAVAVADGDNLALAIEADLQDPGDKSYFAWLSSDIDGNNLLLVGKLAEKGGKYVLPASVKGAMSSYQKLVITIESNEDDKPETKVAIGNLKS